MELNRRKVLGTVGSLAVAGSGLAALSGGATATAGADINDVSLKSDDGTIEYIRTDTSGQLNWDGFDRPATHAQIRVAVLIGQDGQLWKGVIHDTNTFALDDVSGEGSSDGWGGDDEYSSGSGTNGYLHTGAVWDIIQADSYTGGGSIPSDPAPAGPLYESSDGETNETAVTLRSTYMLYTEEDDGSLTQLTNTKEYPDNPVAEATFTVSVTNEKSSAGFSDGSGSASGGVDEDR